MYAGIVVLLCWDACHMLQMAHLVIGHIPVFVDNSTHIVYLANGVCQSNELSIGHDEIQLHVFIHQLLKCGLENTVYAGIVVLLCWDVCHMLQMAHHEQVLHSAECSA